MGPRCSGAGRGAGTLGTMATPIDSFALVALTMVACVTRLWRLHHPATPVYDETHVGRFLGWYHDRAFFFDVHGPFAKLSMYWSAVTLGFDGRNSCPYESAEPYVASCDMLPQRLLPAVCGAALVPLTYCTCARMQLRPQAMLLAAWFVLIDTHLVGVSRLHLNDAIQLLLIALTHYFALAATAAPPPPPAPLPPWPPLLLQLGATGLCLGCALQSKYAIALTTAHYPPLTIHYSLPTAHSSLLTAHHSPLATNEWLQVRHGAHHARLARPAEPMAARHPRGAAARRARGGAAGGGARPLVAGAAAAAARAPAAPALRPPAPQRQRRRLHVA
jgi:hypothetical protein